MASSQNVVVVDDNTEFAILFVGKHTSGVEFPVASLVDVDFDDPSLHERLTTIALTVHPALTEGWTWGYSVVPASHLCSFEYVPFLPQDNVLYVTAEHTSGTEDCIVSCEDHQQTSGEPASNDNGLEDVPLDNAIGSPEAEAAEEVPDVLQSSPSLSSVKDNGMRDSPIRKRQDLRGTPSKEVFSPGHPRASSSRKSLYPSFNRGTSNVLVGNLPAEVNIDVLLYELGKPLWKAKKVELAIKPALRIVKNNIVKKEATVEMVSVEAASYLHDLKTIEYQMEILPVSQVMVKDLPETVTKPTNLIRVCDIPSEVEDSVLIYEINKCLWKSNKVDRNVKAALRVLEKNMEKNEAIVEMVSVEAASDLSAFMEIEYEMEMLMVAQVMEEVVSIKMKHPSNKVLVSQLPLEMQDGPLLYEINKCLWKAKKVECKVNPAVQILQKDMVKKEAVVQMVSVEAATFLNELKQIEYLLEMLPVCQILEETPSCTKLTDDSCFYLPSDDSDEEDNDETVLRNSQFIRVTNVPSGTKKDDLINFITAEMVAANFISKGEKCILQCQVKGQKQPGIYMLKMRCAEEANLACLLENLVFCSEKLIVQKSAVDSENNDLGQYWSIVNVINAVCLLTAEEPSPVQSNISLHSDEGELMFIKLLIKYRHDFPKRGSHDRPLSMIQRVLIKKNIHATPAELKARRKSLKCLFNTKAAAEKTSHFIYNPGRVMFDGGDVELVRGTKYDPADIEELCASSEQGDRYPTFGEALMKFSNGAPWTTKASIALVTLLVENSAEYWKAPREPEFWPEVSKALTHSNHYYYPKQCEERDKILRCSYKDDVQDYEQSGSAGLQVSMKDAGDRELHDLMGQLMRGKVSVHPKSTVAGGLLSEHKQDGQVSSTVGRFGKSRPPLVKRKPSLVERRVAAMEEKARAWTRIASNYEPKHATDTGADSDDD